MRALAVRVIAVVSLLAACGDDGVADAAVGTWTDPDGRPLGDGSDGQLELVVYRGAEHCDWQTARYMLVSLPVSVAQQVVNAVYSRDPDGVLAGRTAAAFSDNAVLPADARFSGYHRGDVELWLAPSTADQEIYLVRGDRVERWPRQLDFALCA